MIKSPKEKFQESQIRTGRWANIIADPIFEEACDSALLQMQADMPLRDSDFNHDAQCNREMVGAWRFFRILKTIHEKTEQPKGQTQKGLNYQAGV